MNEPEGDPSNPNMPNKCPQCGGSLPAGGLEGLCPACLLAQGVTPETRSEAAPFQPPTVEEVARLFLQLEILALIGKGGMGAVYKARQPDLDRFVALKILPPEAASGPGFAERFNQEARALARLSHPNIVAVHEFGQVNGLPFFIMEFVDGLNLRQLERSRKLSAREALQIVPQICEALQFAHDEGIVHRDIKPENILLDKKGRVKIADFGIAKIMGREADVEVTETQGAIGTPNYMAPEQMEKPETVDHRADIFALGVVFYEMLTGELPLGKFGPPSSRRVEVDVRLDEVVLRALEKEPERRYQQASQVKTAVETIAGTAGSAPPPPPDAEAFTREVLARDSDLDIGSCFRRGWVLVASDFWPAIGIAALIALLSSAAHSSLIGLVVTGPLMGGLWLYFLKKVRGEKAGIETAFSGFSVAFAPLMLAGLITKVLTFVGFLCLILPGIYLLVSWKFALPLVADKRLDFWPAMELSRRVVEKHWWKFFAFGLLAFLLNLAGIVLLCGLGGFFTAPFTLAAAAYAYEDIFGAAGRTAGIGPHGTAVLPGAASPPKK
jgi:predicted Ser/Thr protein kinase